MLFNSITFVYFFIIFFVLYWLLKNHLRGQNILLLFASYIFYGWWDYRFLSLIIFSTIIDYFCGLRIANAQSKSIKRLFFAISLIINLGLLGAFKYLGFFIDSFQDLLEVFGIQQARSTLQIILPVGISFYTFQTMSYSIDIFRGRMQPTKDFISFAAFVSFFPQLVAGPIERASHLLPQIEKKRGFDYQKSKEGVKIALYGLFKKVAIADTAAPFVNDIFANYEQQGPLILLLGAILFPFLIYGDFSGYCDIARGISYLQGIELMINFKQPYFSKNIGEFWKRWHISLSTWFRDYVYIPLGGSKFGLKNTLRNIYIIFLVSGFWHGANWTFIIWGGIHATLYLPVLLAKRKTNYANTHTKSALNGLKMFLTFLCVTLAWVYFRADNIQIANDYILRIFSFGKNSFEVFTKTSIHLLSILKFIVALVFMLFIDGLLSKEKHLSTKLFIFSITLGLIFLGSYRNAIDFIYFQF